VKHVPVKILNVFLNGRQRRKVGRLAAQNRRILFEYDPALLTSGLEISPFHLPARSGTMVGDTTIFDGLFGVFNDSLPDGWGRLLLDRAVERFGIARGELTPLDRLTYVGRNGMGALSYEPEKSHSGDGSIVLELDHLANDAARILAGEHGGVIETLLKLNGASSGARPKVVAHVSADKSKLIYGAEALRPGYAHWIIKFPSAVDDSDAGAVEFAYSLMARAAGIAMPETYLFRAKKRHYFGIKRFDRDGDRRIHMHSLSGLLHADHRTPSLDYDGFLKATQILTKDIREVERAFRLACFNVLAHNRDDHSKNVSFLLDDATGQWSLAPAYDLTFSFGPGGEQSMMLMGEGKSPGIDQLRALSKKHGLRNGASIIDDVRAAVDHWPQHADTAGVALKSTKTIGSRIVQPASKPAAKKQTRHAAEKKSVPAKTSSKKSTSKPKRR
jgi:serine/threonine-protein kinase HipA